MESPVSFASRVLGICAVGWLAVFNLPASAQNNTIPNAGVSGVLLDFGDMSNGWHLNANCKALKRAERREFEWGYFRIRELIEQEIGEDAATQINNTSREFAKADKYQDCGPETKKLISRALVTSQHMNKALMDSTYDPDSSYNEHLSEQFMIIETGLRVDASCRHLQPSLLATVARAHDAMIGYTLRVIGGKPINKLLSAAEKASKGAEYDPCGPASEKAVYNASKHLREQIELIEHDAVLVE